MTANAPGVPWNSGRRGIFAKTEETEKGLVTAWIEESEAVYGLRGDSDEIERGWDERFQRVAKAMLDADKVRPLRASDLTHGIGEMHLYLPVAKVRLSTPLENSGPRSVARAAPLSAPASSIHILPKYARLALGGQAKVSVRGV